MGTNGSNYDADFEQVLKEFEGKNKLKTTSGKGHFDTKEGSVRHVYVTKDNVPKSQVSTFLERRMKMAGPDTFLKKRVKLSGPIGAAATVGALAGVALEKGINKIKSMKGKDDKPTPSEVESKKKGGLVRFKKQYQMHNGKF